MLVVSVLSVGQHCIIAAKSHLAPAESAKTLMSLAIATPPIP